MRSNPRPISFPKEITPGYLAQMKRKAHLHGLDVSSGAIRNVFTLPDGPELDKWHTHVDTWVDHYAAIGCPIIRVFAGKAPKGIPEEQAIDNAVRNLSKACKRAGEKGIILALENHDFLMDSRRLQAIVEHGSTPPGSRSTWTPEISSTRMGTKHSSGPLPMPPPFSSRSSFGTNQARRCLPT